MEFSTELRGKRVLFGTPEHRDQFGKALLVKVTHGRIAVPFHPFRMLRTQILVNLLLKLAVRMNLLKHDNSPTALVS
jgi:hypothetical protein